MNKTSNTKLYPNLARAVVEAMDAIFEDGQYADKVIERLLKSDPRWGARDRAFIAESLYDIVRWYRLLYEIDGKPPRSQADWWRIFGISLVVRGVQLPPWAEFKALSQDAVRERWQALKQQRAIAESVPDWMDELGQAELGDRWPETLRALNTPARVVLRANTLKTSPTALAAALAEEGIEVKPLDREALLVTVRKNLFATKAFQSGWFEIQDYSSQQVALALDPQPGQRVVDACAGAGGKALHIAALMENKGLLIAMDTEAWKLDTLRHRARRNGAHIIEPRPISSMKVVKRLHQSADRLLLDVPCSGMGVLRRNPDAKWKLSPEFIVQVQATQQDILLRYSQMLKPGGKMVYATCSILPSENEAQVARFLASPQGSSFSLSAQTSILPQDKGFDGFFIAVLERT